MKNKPAQHRNKHFAHVSISTDTKQLVFELCEALHVKQCDLIEQLIKDHYESFKSKN